MALLERSQLSRRRLSLLALVDQLQANPAAVGRRVEPEAAWRTLVEAEHRDPRAVADILMYPTVGVWLTRALHHTRPGRAVPWPELGYLHLVAAAAAVRSGYPCTVRVPVWRGLVPLPTVGHARLPGAFPVGAVDVVSAGPRSRIEVNRAVSIPLGSGGSAFTPARRHVRASRGLALRTWVEDTDPYHAFGDPRAPVELTGSEFAEWRKLLDEAWDVLTLHHPGHARELAAGLRVLGPIEPDVDTVGASSPAAFGAIRLSATGSATEFAEALVHEMQHSKLNAVLGLLPLAQDQGHRYLAPWRDDPRPLVGLVHGIYAFTCGVEFWLAQEPAVREVEARTLAFTVAHRRVQIRRAIDTARDSGQLTRPGEALVAAVAARLTACDRATVGDELTRTVTAMVDDHQASWRLRYVRPDAGSVDAVADAWVAGDPPPRWSGTCRVVTEDDHRRLPANRRVLLRAKASEPDLFASLVDRPAALPGTTPLADAAFCTGDLSGASARYERRVRAEPEDTQAWVGLGLALRAQGRDASALLEHPELTLAVHRAVRARGGPPPDPTALSTWLGDALPTGDGGIGRWPRPHRAPLRH